jgi:hypothetical protein
VKIIDCGYISLIEFIGNDGIKLGLYIIAYVLSMIYIMYKLSED